MIYEYVGPGAAPNTKKYIITLKLFRDQLTTGAAMPVSVFIGIFNNDNNLDNNNDSPDNNNNISSNDDDNNGTSSQET